MSTNPQSPQGSPSEARGSQSPSPIWVGCKECGGSFNIASVRLCPACHPAEKLLDKSPTPAGAEGRQSPGLEERLARLIAPWFGLLADGEWKRCTGNAAEIIEALAATPSQEEGPAGVDPYKRDGARVPANWVETYAREDSWGPVIQALARDLMDMTAAYGSAMARLTTPQAPASSPRPLAPDPQWPEDRETPPRGTHRDLWRSLHDLCRIVRSTTEESIRSSLEAYLAGSFDEFGAKIEQTFSDRPPEDTPIEAADRGISTDGRILAENGYGPDFRATGTPIEAAGLEAATIRTALHLGMSQADPKERGIYEAALEALAHPPKGETPSEAAVPPNGREITARAYDCEHDNIWSVEILVWKNEKDARGYVLQEDGFSKSFAEKIAHLINRRDPAPGTPIENAAREGALALLREFAATESTKDLHPRAISQKEEAELVIERFEDWLSSLPQEGAAGEGGAG